MRVSLSENDLSPETKIIKTAIIRPSTMLNSFGVVVYFQNSPWNKTSGVRLEGQSRSLDKEIINLRGHGHGQSLSLLFCPTTRQPKPSLHQATLSRQTAGLRVQDDPGGRPVFGSSSSHPASPLPPPVEGFKGEESSRGVKLEQRSN